MTLFTKLTQVSRVVGWDDRFTYIEQSFWNGDDCTSHMLLRSAFISKAGIVPPQTVLCALGQPEVSPPLPDWMAARALGRAATLAPPEVFRLDRGKS